MAKDIFHIVEEIRREDARALKGSKKRLIKVEIDAETYLAKEMLHQQSILYAVRQEIQDLRRDIARLRFLIEGRKNSSLWDTTPQAADDQSSIG